MFRLCKAGLPFTSTAGDLSISKTTQVARPPLASLTCCITLHCLTQRLQHYWQHYWLYFRANRQIQLINKPRVESAGLCLCQCVTAQRRLMNEHNDYRTGGMNTLRGIILLFSSQQRDTSYYFHSQQSTPWLQIVNILVIFTSITSINPYARV